MAADYNGPGSDPWTVAAIEQNRRWLSAFLLAATGDATAAEDLVQEVFKTAYEKRAAFTPGTNFGAWLRAIARNCLNRFFEKRQRQPVLVGDALSELEKAAAESEGRLLDPEWTDRRVGALRACMKTIGQRARRILERRYGLGESATQVAEGLKMGVSAVNVAAFRARGALFNCVKRKLAL